MQNMIAEKIKDALTMEQVLSFYGFETTPKRRIPCPIHNGEDNNFCYTDKVYHCWTCGARGDVITFVQDCFGIDFYSAIQKLDSDFCLGYVSKPTRRDKIDWKLKLKIDSAMRKYRYDKDRYYLALSTLHSELWKRICNGETDLMIVEMERSLDNWLDENVEEVVQPWTM